MQQEIEWDRDAPILTTEHRVRYGDAREMGGLPNGSVDLVVTSPPYPMIELWDSLFAALDPRIGEDV